MIDLIAHLHINMQYDDYVNVYVLGLIVLTFLAISLTHKKTCYR